MEQKAEGQDQSLIFNLVILTGKCLILQRPIHLELYLQRSLYITVILWDINRCAMIGRHHHMILYTGLNKVKMVSLLQNPQ